MDVEEDGSLLLKLYVKHLILFFKLIITYSNFLFKSYITYYIHNNKVFYKRLTSIYQRPNGTTFVVAKVDCELPRRAVRGDVVTFSHDFSRRIGMHDLLAQDNTQRMQRGAATMQEAVRGVPANIVVHRIRTDVFWEDVMNNAGQLVRQFHNGLSRPSYPFSSLLSSS